MKKIGLVVLATTLLTAGLTSCEKKVKIGILQPVEHEAFKAAREGFMEGLEEEGYGKDKVRFIYRNGKGKEASISSFAKDLVSRCDMSLGIGTGASVSLKSAATDKGLTKPLLFTAVTDPVDAKLVDSMLNGEGFVTGTSDMQPIADQVMLIKECVPSVDKVGILYTASESNSEVQAKIAEAALELNGITAVRKTCTGPSDISTAALALTAEDGLDAIYIPTDNNIADNTDAVKTAVAGKKILVVTGEEGMLKGCGHVTLSVDYKALGKETGKMAAAILKSDKSAGEFPVKSMTAEECNYVMSEANCASSEIELPQAIKDKCKNVD